MVHENHQSLRLLNQISGMNQIYKVCKFVIIVLVIAASFVGAISLIKSGIALNACKDELAHERLMHGMALSKAALSQCHLEMSIVHLQRMRNISAVLDSSEVDEYKERFYWI